MLARYAMAAVALATCTCQGASARCNAIQLRPPTATSMNDTPETATHASRSPRRAMPMQIISMMAPTVKAIREPSASEPAASSSHPAPRTAPAAPIMPARAVPAVARSRSRPSIASSIRPSITAASTATWASKRASTAGSAMGSHPRYATTNSADTSEDSAAMSATRCSERAKAASAPVSISAALPKKAPQNPNATVSMAPTIPGAPRDSNRGAHECLPYTFATPLPPAPTAMSTVFNFTFVPWFRSVAPYIHMHRGKTFVIGMAGEAVAAGKLQHIAQDLALIQSMGVRIVLVHGFRPQVTEQLKAKGHEARYSHGMRITDEVALDSAQEAAGQLRYEIEAAFSQGLPNTPMAGSTVRVISGNFITARPIGILDGIDFQHTGLVRKVDV